MSDQKPERRVHRRDDDDVWGSLDEMRAEMRASLATLTKASEKTMGALDRVDRSVAQLGAQQVIHTKILTGGVDSEGNITDGVMRELREIKKWLWRGLVVLGIIGTAMLGQVGQDFAKWLTAPRKEVSVQSTAGEFERPDAGIVAGQ